METTRADKRISLLLAIFLLCIYILTSPGTMQALDEQIMYEATESLARGHLAISHPAGVQGRGGLHYSKYGIGLPLIALPFWAIGALVVKALPDGISDFVPRFMVSMVNPVITAITAGILYLFCLHLFDRRRFAIFAAFAWALGTLAWPYTQTFFSEPATALFLILTIYFLLRLKQTGHEIDAWLAGISLGLAMLVRPAAIISGIGILIYGAYVIFQSKKTKDAIRFITPLTISIAVICLYNWIRFESAINFGYGEESFTNPIMSGLYGFLLSPGKSVFLYTPILLATIPGILVMYKKYKPETAAVTISTTATLLFYSAWAGWDNWSWGPRYLVAILPLLIISIMGLLEINRSLIRGCLYVLFALSMAVQLYALPVSAQSFYYHEYLAGDKDFMQKTEFEWRHSPLIGQGREVFRVIGNIMDIDKLGGIARERDVSEQTHGKDYYFEHNVNYQSLNFWWFYLLLLGFHKVLVILMILLLGAIVLVSGRLLWTELAQSLE